MPEFNAVRFIRYYNIVHEELRSALPATCESFRISYFKGITIFLTRNVSCVLVEFFSKFYNATYKVKFNVNISTVQYV